MVLFVLKSYPCPVYLDFRGGACLAFRQLHPLRHPNSSVCMSACAGGRAWGTQVGRVSRVPLLRSGTGVCFVPLPGSQDREGICTLLPLGWGLDVAQCERRGREAGRASPMPRTEGSCSPLLPCLRPSSPGEAVEKSSQVVWDGPRVWSSQGFRVLHSATLGFVRLC